MLFVMDEDYTTDIYDLEGLDEEDDMPDYDGMDDVDEY